MYKCINCAYKGEEIKDDLFCPVCGDWIEGKKPTFNKEVLDLIEKKEIEEMILADKKDVDINKQKEEIDSRLDLNNDGKIDEEDAKVAAKVMNIRKKQKASKKK